MIDVLVDVFIVHGVPSHIRSDNVPEFVAKAVQAWISGVGGKKVLIEPGSPWKNGFVESFDENLRNELLSTDVFHT